MINKGMQRTYKYRAYASQQTIENAERWIELCRWLYNTALEQRILAYRQVHKSLSLYNQQNELPELKIALPEFKVIGAQTLQDVLQRVDKTYMSFFRNGFGFPRFKGKYRYDSFTLTQNNWKLEGKYLYITKVGIFKLKLSRSIEGDIKTVTIKRSPTNKWYVCFSCDNVPIKRLRITKKTIGIDVGLKAFCVDSEGNKVDNPRYFKQAGAMLRRKQRRLARRVKGSKGRQEARLQVAKHHEYIRNQRNDFLHKTANYYVHKYGLISVENLKIKNMVKNHHFAKSISDASWGKFFEYLEYKAEGAGRQVIKVDPKGTSQICSKCGEKVEKTLAQRVHKCPYCGLELDRDFNSAIEIDGRGQRLQAQTYGTTQCVA